jgi:hypothetical protein
MALFKISKGLKSSLPTTKTAGHCWYTIDDSMFYIDYEDQNGQVQRKALNSKEAESLIGYSIATLLNSSNVEIPTSKAVLDKLNNYYTKDQIENMEFITIEDIDAICGGSIVAASEVKY